MTPFSKLFTQALSDANLKVGAFAEKVGANPTTISATKSGSRLPPKGEKLLCWCAVLKLEAKAQKAFIRAASLTRCDAIAKKHIASLERKIRRLQIENLRLRHAQKNTQNTKKKSVSNTRIHDRAR